MSAHLTKGPLSVDRALEYATQIASALDKAHRAGIVHRDLKPSNVMLTKAGAKLLDFGLAKQRQSAVSATRDAELTGPGVILGTAQYMAPEQVEGKEADARTDLFAFGLVLFEMLTAKKAFETRSDAMLIAAIMSAPPPRVTELRSDVPPGVEYVIARCLAKEPDDRWQTARDLLAELQRIKSDVGAPVAGSDRRLPARARALAWLAGMASVAALILAAFFISRSPATTGALWFSILPPPAGFDLSPDPAVSPDGRYVAYKAQDDSHRTQIWLKALDAANASPIAGTEGTDYTAAHFWSPDSRSLGFFAQGKVKRIGIEGGTPQVLAGAPEPRGGTWSPSGVIVFNADTQHLMRVPASGGAATEVADVAEGVRLFPFALPDGDHYLFTSRNVRGLGQGVYVGALKSPEVRRISDAWSPAQLANGHLIFARQKGLFVQRFDSGRLELSGDPVRIADDVGVGYGTPLSFSFSASEQIAVYWAGTTKPPGQLTWFDRSGRVLATVADAAGNVGFTLARESGRAAIERSDPATSTMDVWLLDVDSRAGASRLTTEGPFTGAQLSPDGRRLAVMERGRGLITLPVSGGTTDVIVPGGTTKFASDWSRDGHILAFVDNTPTSWRLWTAPVNPPAPAVLYREAPFLLASMMFSPDGRWVAYASYESGRSEVYIDSFPTPEQRIRVSTAGGGWPKWRRDGKEMYYLALDRKLMMATIGSGAKGLTVSTPQALFEGPGVNPDATRTQFEPSPDGSRFLFNARVEDHASVGVSVIANWPALLKK